MDQSDTERLDKLEKLLKDNRGHAWLTCSYDGKCRMVVPDAVLVDRADIRDAIDAVGE